MLIWTGIAAVIILTALTPWAVRQKRRQRRLRAGRQGDTDALWRELSDTAVDMGYVWSAARTPRQVAAWLARPPLGEAFSQRTTHSPYRRLCPTVRATRRRCRPGAPHAADAAVASAARPM